MVYGEMTSAGKRRRIFGDLNVPVTEVKLGI